MDLLGWTIYAPLSTKTVDPTQYINSLLGARSTFKSCGYESEYD